MYARAKVVAKCQGAMGGARDRINRWSSSRDPLDGFTLSPSFSFAPQFDRSLLVKDSIWDPFLPSLYSSNRRRIDRRRSTCYGAVTKHAIEARIFIISEKWWSHAYVPVSSSSDISATVVESLLYRTGLREQTDLATLCPPRINDGFLGSVKSIHEPLCYPLSRLFPFVNHLCVP